MEQTAQKRKGDKKIRKIRDIKSNINAKAQERKVYRYFKENKKLY